jgi:hypothetical protein
VRAKAYELVSMMARFAVKSNFRLILTIRLHTLTKAFELTNFVTKVDFIEAVRPRRVPTPNKNEIDKKEALIFVRQRSYVDCNDLGAK